MSKEFDANIRALRAMNVSIRHKCEQAEAKVQEANSIIRQLGDTGWNESAVFLGPVIACLPYPPNAGRSDTGSVVVAMLHVPLGIGVGNWDSETYYELQAVDQGLESEATLAFTPFAECEPAIKALLFRHIEPLLAQLMQQLPHIATDLEE